MNFVQSSQSTAEMQRAPARQLRACTPRKAAVAQLEGNIGRLAELEKGTALMEVPQRLEQVHWGHVLEQYRRKEC